MAVYRDSAGVLRDDQGFTGGGAIDPNTAFKVVQPDEQGSANLDLTGNNAILIPIDGGKGIIGVDVTGLTGSGATIVCEMQIGDTWKPSNMLVNGTGGAFSQSLTVDGQFRSSSAAKWTTRIRVSVPGTGTAKVSWALSTAASVIQLGAPIPPGTNAIGTIGVTSLPAVSLAPSQSVAIAGTPTVNANVTFPSNQAVTVSNLPATQPVSGTVTANVTFPASQPVTGTFWQATQPISATSLPLPTGAATASGVQAVVTTLGTPMQQTGGTVTANLGTLNGAATAAKQDAIVSAIGQRLTVNDYRLPNADAGGAITPKVASDVSFLVASTTPCNLFSAVVIGRPDGAAAYVFLLNSATVPASGSAIDMTKVLAMSGYSIGGGANIAPEQIPDRYSTGLVVLVSSTIDTYTPLTGVNRPKYIKVRVL